MGIITLTDRISVSVRAKNETESNRQKRATGKNIANALTSGGNADISDALADQLGNTSKPTIADEQGREWVAMSDIIAAGKKMQQEGAFDEKEVHEGLKEDGSIYNIVGNVLGPGTYEYHTDRSGSSGQVKFIIPETMFGYVTYSMPSSADGFVRSIVFSIFGKQIPGELPSIAVSYGSSGAGITLRATSASVDNTSYSYFRTDKTIDPGMADTWKLTAAELASIGLVPVQLTNNSYPLKCEAGYLFGNVRHSGGSLIDWTKPDDEIEEDIRNLHQTWDVSDHAGSTTANGTYVLAGPIEFNPGD